MSGAIEWALWKLKEIYCKSTGEFLPTVNELLQMYGTAGPTITLRRYELDLNGDYRNVLRRIKNSGDYSFVVVGSMATLPEFFKQVCKSLCHNGVWILVINYSRKNMYAHNYVIFLQAQQVGLMTSDYRYIVGNLDLQTIDLEPFQHGDTNITGMRLVSPEMENVQNLAKALYETDDPFQNGKQKIYL